MEGVKRGSSVSNFRYTPHPHPLPRLVFRPPPEYQRTPGQFGNGGGCLEENELYVRGLYNPNVVRGLAVRGRGRGNSHGGRGNRRAAAPAVYARVGAGQTGVESPQQENRDLASQILERVVIPDPREPEQIEPGCICERAITAIHCSDCGFCDETGKIRVQKSCPVHPKNFCYTDISICPDCSNDKLQERLQ